ncbi:hypothetical protein BH11BAC2_BH11BAC2_08250 [soil metagenome]
MSKNTKNKHRKLRQKTVQKIALRRIVVAGSALALVAITFIYLNFSKSSDSRAAVIENQYRISYQTTDMNVPMRLLKTPTATERTLQNNYKNSATAIRPFQTRTHEVTNINAE